MPLKEYLLQMVSVWGKRDSHGLLVKSVNFENFIKSINLSKYIPYDAKINCSVIYISKNFQRI